MGEAGILLQRRAGATGAGAVAAALETVRVGDIEIDELYTAVLAPLLVDTGNAWQRGAERVWEEHFVTATVRTIVESLYLDVVALSSSRPRIDRRAVLACPSEEAHDLGLRMLADRMQLVGWDVYFLGADTPAEEISAAAASLNAELVVLSAATHYNRAQLRCFVDDLHELLPDTRIGVGGPAFAHGNGWPDHEILTWADLGLSEE
jgi:methanogenic corrinoid protein MtbC1